MSTLYEALRAGAWHMRDTPRYGGRSVKRKVQATPKDPEAHL